MSFLFAKISEALPPPELPELFDRCGAFHWNQVVGYPVPQHAYAKGPTLEKTQAGGRRAAGREGYGIRPHGPAKQEEAHLGALPKTYRYVPQRSGLSCP